MRPHHESGRTNQPRTLNTNTPIAVLYIYDLVFLYPCHAGAALTSASLSSRNKLLAPLSACC